MPSAFDEIFADLAPELLAQLGDSVVWIAPHGTETPLQGIVGPVQTAEEIVDSGKQRRRTRTIKIPVNAAAADGGPFVDAPSTKAKVRIGEEVWPIKSCEGVSGGLAIFTLETIAAVERTREQYRRRA